MTGENDENADCGCTKANANVPFKFAIICIDLFVEEATHHGSVVSLLAANLAQ